MRLSDSFANTTTHKSVMVFFCKLVKLFVFAEAFGFWGFTRLNVTRYQVISICTFRKRFMNVHDPRTVPSFEGIEFLGISVLVLSYSLSTYCPLLDVVLIALSWTYIYSYRCAGQVWHYGRVFVPSVEKEEVMRRTY